MSSSAPDCGWNSGTTGETPLYIQSYSFATKLWENKFESGESGDGIYVYLTRDAQAYYDCVCVTQRPGSAPANGQGEGRPKGR